MKAKIITIFLSLYVIAVGQGTVEPIIVKQSDIDAVMKSCVSPEDFNKVKLSITNLSMVNIIGTIDIRRKEGVTDLVNINLAPLFGKKANFLIINSLRLDGVKIVLPNQEVAADRKSMDIANIEISNSEVSDWECFKDCNADMITITSSMVVPINVDDKFKFKKYLFIGETTAAIKSSFDMVQTPK